MPNIFCLIRPRLVSDNIPTIHGSKTLLLRIYGSFLLRLLTFKLANLLWSPPQSPANPPTLGRPTPSTTGTSMAAQPNQPALTPQFCFSTVYLRDFLRASRAVDDTITQHLNALVTPSRAGFDPSSTAYRPHTSSYSYSSLSHSTAPAPACQSFRDTVLFPSWQARDDVIRYCSGVAEAAVAQDVKDKAVANTAAAAAAAAFEAAAGVPLYSKEDKPSKHREPITERDDPYINRQQYSLVEPQANLLASLMRQEQGVETIVRARSWDVLQSRCGGSAVVGAASGEPGWEAALAHWQKQQGRQ